MYNYPGRSWLFQSLDLCKTCKKIDLHDLMRKHVRDFPPSGFQVATWLETPSEMAARSCPQCQLFASVASRYYTDYRQQLLAFRTWPEPMPMTVEGESPLFLAVRPNDTPDKYSVDVFAPELAQSGLLVPQPPGRKYINRVERDNIDYSLLASWLQSCQLEHTMCRKPSGNEAVIQRLTLINCSQGLVETVPFSDAVYLALSYVWGKKYQTKDTSSISDLSCAPRTVKDAMIVVQKLGYNYLWVDKYCINQEDPDEQARTIQNMHLIYGHAEATIVALYGDNDNVGLPGVSSTTRLRQPSFRHGDLELISSLPDIWSVIEASHWNTRGWTYQEARLSQKCFFFSEYQVYFSCQMASQSESINPRTSTVYNAMSTYPLKPNLFEAHHLGPASLALDCATYTQRKLTWKSDALNAFRGILSHWSWYSIWGIPIMPIKAKLNCYDGFAMGLCWDRRPSRFIKAHEYPVPWDVLRRDGFPTWSWTSISGKIQWEKGVAGSILESYVNELDCRVTINYSRLGVSLLTQSDEWHPLHTVIENSKTGTLVEASPRILIDGDVAQVWLENPQESYEWWTFAGSPENLSVRDLPFYTDVDATSDPTEFTRFATPHFALVLVNWFDIARPEETPSRRLVLIVLEKVTDTLFKRAAILSSYSQLWNEEDFAKITLRRMQFYLT